VKYLRTSSSRLEFKSHRATAIELFQAGEELAAKDRLRTFTGKKIRRKDSAGGPSDDGPARVRRR